MELRHPARGSNRPDADERAWRAVRKGWADVHVLLTPEFVVDWVSPSISYVVGWHPQDLVGRNYEEFIHPDLAEEGMRMALDMMRHPDGFDPAAHLPGPDEQSLVCPAHVLFRRPDGRYVPMESRGNIHLNDPDIGGFHLVLRDVTDLHTQDRLLSLIAGNAPLDEMVVAICDTVEAQVPGTRATLVFPAQTDIDIPQGPRGGPEGARGGDLRLLEHVQDVMQLLQPDHHVLDEPTVAATGWASVWALPLLSPDGLVAMGALLVWTGAVGEPMSWVTSILTRLARLGSIGLARISDLEQLHRAAASDPLTGIANRREFERSLALAAQQPAGTWAVFYLDLDDFKAVNDVHGHAVGDEVLQQTAQRISSAIRGGDVAARIGGDEFTVLCSNLSCELDAHRVAERLLGALTKPMHLVGIGEALDVGVSVGFATTGEPSEVPVLLSRADAEMYSTKHRRSMRMAAR